MSDLANQIEIKVVLVGSVGVGKTSTVLRFIKDSFKEYLETTIGASYMCKNLNVQGKNIKFSVWDTAGQEQYHSLVPLYFRKAAAVIVVYDITRAKTFDDAKQWVKELGHQAPEDVIIALTGNKCDLNNLREVDLNVGTQYAEEIGSLFVETSAKKANGVKELFEKIGQTYLERLDNGRSKDDDLNNDRTNGALGDLNNSSTTPKKPCCGSS